MADKDEGTWVDVAPLHEPEKKGKGEGKKRSFEHNVGLEGYERGTGEEVVREPSFKRPSDRKPPSSRPFSD